MFHYFSSVSFRILGTFLLFPFSLLRLLGFLMLMCALRYFFAPKIAVD